MVDIKSFGKRKGSAGGVSGGMAPGGAIGDTVAREAMHAAKADIALRAREADEASRATVAGYATEAGEATHAGSADEAVHAGSAHELDADSPTRREFLNRKHVDSAEKLINFIEGLTVGAGGGHGMDANGDVTGRKVEADRGNFGDILMEYLSSAGFAPGLLGSGAGIWQDDAGKWHLDVDAITARQSLTVLELLIQRIRAVGGAIVLSQASGKVAEVVETGTGAGGDSYYRLYLEDGGDGDFVAGDFVRCSHWAGDSGNPQRMHAYWEEVVKADRDPAKNGRRFIGIRRPTGTGVTPSAGDELVLMGSRVVGRQGLIEITTEAGRPRITEWAGIDSPSLDAEKMVTCLGDLTGIEWQGRRLTGYGLMTRNFYGTGEIVLSTGKTAEEAFSELGDRVSAMRQGVRNLVLNSGAWTPDRDITITPGQAPGATMPAHWRPLNDGCAAAVADGLLVLRKDSALKPDGTAASRNGLHAGLSRDAIPKGTALTVKVAGAAGNIAAGKSIQVTLYNTQPGWTHAVTLCRVTAADLAKDGSFSIEKSVTLAEEYSVPRLCVSLHNANEGAFIKLANVGLYAGDRAPELWTPAPEDAEERQQAATAAARAAAAEAQRTADAATVAASGAQASVGELEGYVNEAFRDGIITEMEAAAIAKYTNTVNTAGENLASTYNALHGNPYLTGTAKTALENAYRVVSTAVSVLLQTIRDVTADSKITGTEPGAVDAAFAAFNTASGDFSAAVEDANKAIQATLGDASAAAKAAADNAKAAAEAAKQDAQSAKDAADKAAQDADKALADLEDKVKTSIRDGILTAAEKASLTRQLKEVHGAAMEMQEAVSAITSNSRLPGENWTEIAGGFNAFNTALGVLNSAIGAIVNAKELTSEQLKGYGDTINAAYDGYNSAISALRAAIERGNAAIQSAIEAEARDAADKAAQAVADGLSARNLVPMSGLWEAVPGKDDGWGMLNGGCVASVADHRLSMVKDGDGRNGMWAGLTVPSLPKGQKVTLRVKGMVGREFVAGENDDGTPSRVIISLYNTSPAWTHNVGLAEIREAGDFEVARTVELGQDYSVPKLCFSMQNAPEGTGLRLDWVALYAGSWAPGGWTPAPEDARRMVTAREASIRHDFEVSEKGLSDRIESSVTEYRTRFGALRNLLVATRQQDGGIAGTREVFVPSRDYIDYDIPVTLVKGKTYRFDLGGWRDSHAFRGVTVSVLRGDGGTLVAGQDIVFEDGDYCVFIDIPSAATGTLSGCRLRISPLDDGSEGTLERVKLSEGTTHSEWTPAPEDAETYREETHTLFSVTDGLIRSEVEKAQEYTDGQYGELAGQIAQVRRDTRSEIRQTASDITVSVDEKVGAVNTALGTLEGKMGTQASELRSEIAVGTRLISLSVGEKAIPLGTPPYHNLLRHTNRGVTGWVAANSLLGSGAFSISRQPWNGGADFVKLRRADTSGTQEPSWEWLRFDGLAPNALRPGTYRLHFHMLAYARGAFGLTFLLQDTTGTGDATADNLNAAVRVEMPESGMEAYTSAVFGACMKMQRDVAVTLTVTRAGTLDTGWLRIGTTGRANILELNIGNLRLTKGEELREWTPSTDDYADRLRRTGIDIDRERITLTSDTVEVRNNDGETTALLDKDGMLETSLIRAEELQTNRFIITDGEGRKVISDNEHGDGARVFYYTDDFPDVTDEAVGAQPMFRVGYDPVTKTFMQHYNPDGTIAWTIGKAGTPTAATLPYSWRDYRLARITSAAQARSTRDLGGAAYHMFRSTSRQDNPERPGEAYADSDGRLFTSRSTKSAVIADGLYCDGAVGRFTGKYVAQDPESPLRSASRPSSSDTVTSWSRTVYTVSGGKIAARELVTWNTGGSLLPEA